MKRMAAVAISILFLVGCGSDKRGTSDSPVGPLDKAPADVITFPNQYGNVAHKCDGHGHRVYVMTADVAAVVVEDPSCSK